MGMCGWFRTFSGVALETVGAIGFWMGEGIISYGCYPRDLPGNLGIGERRRCLDGVEFFP